MNKYVGQPCTSCRSVIKEGEQIVVCPICGSPYHKECYAKEGRCVNTQLHENNEEWKPEAHTREFFEEHPEASPDITEDGETVGVVCPRCGQTNQPGAVFCSQCGMPLNMNKVNMPFGGFGNPNMKREDPDLDGVHLSDYGNYIGSNQFYYLPKFLRFSKTKSKISANFTAFFLPQIYFLYRKMTGWGIFSLILTTLISVPNIIFQLIELGMYNVSAANIETLILVNNICAIVSYVMGIGFCLFANYLYFKKAKKDIESIKSENLESGQETLQVSRKGGTSVVYAAIGFFIEFIVTAAIMALLVNGIIVI